MSDTKLPDYAHADDPDLERAAKIIGEAAGLTESQIPGLAEILRMLRKEATAPLLAALKSVRDCGLEAGCKTCRDIAGAAVRRAKT